MRSRRPTRPPVWAIGGAGPEADRSQQDTSRGQFDGKSDLRPKRLISSALFDGGSETRDSFLEQGNCKFMPRARKYPEELIERGVRLALESGRPVAAVARDLGVGHEVLRKRVRQAEADGGLRPDLPSTEEREEIKKLRKENHELRRANEILKAASVFFAIELDADRPR